LWETPQVFLLWGEEETVADQALQGHVQPATGWELVHPSRVLFVASALHVCNDAFFAVLYPIMPFIAGRARPLLRRGGAGQDRFQRQLGGAPVGGRPAGERLGEYGFLAWGNA
jgi:hypothetical protein